METNIDYKRKCESLENQKKQLQEQICELEKEIKEREENARYQHENYQQGLSRLENDNAHFLGIIKGLAAAYKLDYTGLVYDKSKDII